MFLPTSAEEGNKWFLIYSLTWRRIFPSQEGPLFTAIWIIHISTSKGQDCLADNINSIWDRSWERWKSLILLMKQWLEEVKYCRNLCWKEARKALHKCAEHVLKRHYFTCYFPIHVFSNSWHWILHRENTSITLKLTFFPPPSTQKSFLASFSLQSLWLTTTGWLLWLRT